MLENNCTPKRFNQPKDKIDRLSYGLHPDGCINPYESPSMLTEYQLKFGKPKLETSEELDVTRAERNRVLTLMEKLSTVQQRSYTDPHESHYPVIRSVAVKPMVDRSSEAALKHFKMNGRTEYQVNYDRSETEKILSSNKEASRQATTSL